MAANAASMAANAAAERSPSSQPAGSSATTARKRSGKKFVKGPRQPRPTHSPKDGARLGHVDERPESAAGSLQDYGHARTGSAMMVDLEAVAQTDMTAVRVEAMLEFMMYLAQLVRESGVVAKEQLRLTQLARGDDVSLPHTPALDGGFLPGPSSLLLRIPRGAPMEMSSAAPVAGPRPGSRTSEIHAPTPVTGTVSDPAKVLEDIVDEPDGRPPPPPPPKRPGSTPQYAAGGHVGGHAGGHTFSPPVPPPPQRRPSGMLSYGGDMPPGSGGGGGGNGLGASGLGANGLGIQPDLSTSNRSQATPAAFTHQNPAFPSAPSLPHPQYFPFTNPYTNAVGRYPPFGVLPPPGPASYSQGSQAQAPPPSPVGLAGFPGAPSQQQQQHQALQQQRNSWGGFAGVGGGTSAGAGSGGAPAAAPQHAPGHSSYVRADAAGARAALPLGYPTAMGLYPPGPGAAAAAAAHHAAQAAAVAGAASTSPTVGSGGAPTPASQARTGQAHTPTPHAHAQPGQPPAMMVPRPYGDRSSMYLPNMGYLASGAGSNPTSSWPPPHTA